jgi:hypothetical protein
VNPPAPDLSSGPVVVARPHRGPATLANRLPAVNEVLPHSAGAQGGSTTFWFLAS